MISPAFPFSDATDPVVLQQCRAEIKVKNGALSSDAEIRLTLLPRPSIDIVGIYKPQANSHPFKFGFGEDMAKLTLDGQVLEGFTRSVMMSEAGLQIRWCPSQLPIEIPAQDCTGLSRVAFHLFDFFNLRNLSGNTLMLDNGEWMVSIQQEKSVAETVRMIGEDGVCRFTHAAELVRKDGAQFSTEDANRQLEVLRYFLAFLRGTWCDPVCAVGFDAEGSRTWHYISEPRPHMAVASTWFDPYRPEDAAALFPMFHAKWCASDAWRECLREVIYWYVNSNSASGTPGIDASILLTQAALERLSHQYAVVAHRLSSPDGFKSKMLASDKLRILLSSLQIPIDSQPELTSIIKLGSKWLDGPHAFTEIRNSLVHPDAKDREKLTECIYDAWRLGLWYLELSLLAVMGYDGTYGNRLRQRRYGQVEQVPWARTEGD